MDRKERINKAFSFLKYEGIVKTQADVAKKMGSTRANVSSALSGKEFALTDSFLIRFSRTFKQINQDWLLNEEGSMLTIIPEFRSENIPQVLEGTSDKDVIEEQNKITMRIRELIHESGEIPKTFGLKANIELSLFLKKLNGTLTWSVADVHKICDTFRVRKGWLVDGEGDKFRCPEEVLEKIPALPSKSSAQTEDLIDSLKTKPHIPTEVMAGGTTGISEAVTLGQCEMKPVVKMLPSYDYTITIKGDSMSPKFESGDMIAIKKVLDVIEWGKSYVLDTHDGAVLKRLYKDGNKFRCVSYNSEYPDFYIDEDLVEGVYRVVGMVRIL
jgi:phage repressor protein C with HTH and peptisase S24 domain